MKKFLTGVFVILGFSFSSFSGDYCLKVNPYAGEILDKGLEPYLNAIKGACPSPNKCLLIFDVDDTAIVKKNSWDGNIRAALTNGYEVWKNSKHGSILDDARIFLPFQPVLDFYNSLKQSNFKLIFLTRRSEYEKENTLSQLVEAGYDVKADEIYFTDQQPKKNFHSGLGKKFPGFQIVGSIGDNEADDKIDKNFASPDFDIFNLILIWNYMDSDLIDELFQF